MNFNQKPFLARKTTWAAFASILGAVAGAVSGTMDIPQAAQIAVTAVMGLTIRSAINNK